MSVVDARDTSQPDYAVKLKQVCDELRMLKRYIVGSDDLDKLFQLPSVVDTATAHKFLRLSLDRTALEWSSPIADELDIACATLNVADYIAVGTATGSTQEWGTLYAALDMGQAGAVAADNAGLSLYLASNCYRTNTGWKYKTAGTASLIQLVGSVITVKQAVAGVADAAVVFSDSLTLTAAGNLGVNNAVPAHRLDIGAGDARIANVSPVLRFLNADADEIGIQWLDVANGGRALRVYDYDAAAELLRVDSLGNFGLGVVPCPWTNTWTALQVGNGASLAADSGAGAILSSNAYYDGTVWRYIGNYAASVYYQSAGTHTWASAPGGVANAVTTYTRSMVFTPAGRLGVGTDTPGVQLDVVEQGGTNSSIRSWANSATGYGLHEIVAGDGTNTSSFAFTYYLNFDATHYGWKTGLQGNNNYTIKDETAGAIRVTVAATTGNVGFGSGASDPQKPVVVYATSAQIQFVNGNTGVTANDGLVVGMGGASSLDAYINQHENAALVFNTNASECARYTASGQFQQQCATAAVGTYLKNTSAAGLGLRTDGGSAGNYSLSVRNYAGTELFQVSGAGDALATGNGGLGYGAGSGGTVTQLTSKSTGVTLNRASGQITLNNAALAANTTVSFAVACNVLGPNDVVVLNLRSGYATNATYQAWINDVSAGQFVVNLRNVSAGSLSEAVVLSYAIIRGSAT